MAPTKKPLSEKNFTILLWKRALESMNALRKPYPDWLTQALALVVTEMAHHRWVKAQVLLMRIAVRLPRTKPKLRLLK